jgi:hypothetical protein
MSLQPYITATLVEFLNTRLRQRSNEMKLLEIKFCLFICDSLQFESYI